MTKWKNTAENDQGCRIFAVVLMDEEQNQTPPFHKLSEFIIDIMMDKQILPILGGLGPVELIYVV